MRKTGDERGPLSKMATEDLSVVSKLTAASEVSSTDPRLSLSTITIAKRKSTLLAGHRRNSMTTMDLSEEEQRQFNMILEDGEIKRVTKYLKDANVLLVDKTTHS